MRFTGAVQDAALRAIASPRRREILRLVWDEERSSGEIAEQFDVSWPGISQKLRVVGEGGVGGSRAGGWWGGGGGCGGGWWRGGRLLGRGAGPLRVPLKGVLMQMWQSDLDELA